MKHESLSSIELSFWYQYKFDPSSDANNIAHKLVVSKSLDRQTLHDIFRQIVSKHPAFRSNFREEDGTPYRVCHEKSDANLIYGDDLTNNDLREKIAAPFTLESDNLLRVIFVNNKTETTLYIVCPHIIFDARSWNVFIEDFTAAINSKLSVSSYHLTYPHVDTAAQEYWLSKVKGIEGRVDLQQNTAVSTNQGLLVTLSRNDTEPMFEELAAFGKTEGLSMNTLCMAIFAISLSKITDTTQMIIATPVTTRDTETFGHIGAYINVLPSVTEIPRDAPFLKYAKDQSAKIWDDIENRNFSLINLLSSSSSHYDQQGIYNVMVEYVPPAPMNDLIKEDTIIPNGHAKLDLTLSITATASGHTASLEYDGSKFGQDYAEQILQVFFNIANEILEDPRQTISQLPTISSHDTEELIAIGAGPTKEIKAPYIWNRFKTFAQASPSSVAITEKDRALSYKELLELSCQYAGFLAKNGVGKNTVVGIHMERSADYIASMLAIWSLGGVYVPLDTKQPTGRLEYMIDQAGITSVITNGANEFKQTVKCYSIHDSRRTDLRDSSYEPDGDDTAYIIFTSGSTGTPKGVIIKHKGFLNHLKIMIEDLRLNKDDIIAQTAPVSFDISVWQLVCGLIAGASIVVINHDDLIDPDNAYEIITYEHVTVLEIVPSLLSGYLVAEGSTSTLYGKLNDVHVITTGEAISNSIVKQWIAHYPDRPLLNAYGPAEASDDTHFFDITADSINSAHSIPIGRPLLNIQTYVVNQDMQLCPKGVIGEICIGGIAVAGGYIGNKEMTAKSFLPNPFSAHDGSLLYRTGDYGRWREDNLLEYHGRRDHQVKVRGQRLELGEVEDKLRELASIKDAAVIAEKSPSGIRLRGYAVLDTNKDSITDIKQQLQNLLPDYMIPWKLEPIDTLPRSANGKLDRKALESLASTMAHVPSESKSNTESALLRDIIDVYSQTLDTPITSDSNYFDCGGDSLQSMKITALLEKKGIHVGIRDILLYQTPEELAKSIEAKQVTPIHSRTETLILNGNTPIQNYYLEVSGDRYRDSGEIQAAVITIDKGSDLNEAALIAALRNIVAVHSELTPNKRSKPTVISTTHSKVEDTVKDIRTRISLDIPLIGCILPDKDEQRVLLVAHHFVLDFYSWDVIAQELTEIIAQEQHDKKEALLKQWWGQTLNDLTSDTARLVHTKKRWLPSAESQASTDIVSADNSTRQLAYNYTIPEALVENVQKSGVSLESLAYYLFVKAYFTATNEAIFTCNVEATIRSIDSTGTLKHGIGWMTYIFPQSFTQQIMNRVSLKNFHKQSTGALHHGYEYSLLRYNIAPEAFEGEKSPPWTINYIGHATKSMKNIEVIKTSPRRQEAFIEVDISSSGSSFSFEYTHNTTLPTTFFDTLNEKLNGAIAETTNDIKREGTVVVDAARQEAILARLKNARRN